MLNLAKSMVMRAQAGILVIVAMSSTGSSEIDDIRRHASVRS